jgi:hypothetical protein
MGDNIKKNEKRSAYRALVGKPKGNRPLEHRGLGGRIILKWIFKE